MTQEFNEKLMREYLNMKHIIVDKIYTRDVTNIISIHIWICYHL
jgi:hypothetical protein